MWPAGQDSILLTPGARPVPYTFGTWSAWVEIAADVGVGQALAALVVENASAAICAVEVEVGEGAAGAEVTRATARLTVNSNIVEPRVFSFDPFVALTSGSRLAVRVRQAINGTSYRVAVLTVPVAADSNVTASRTSGWPLEPNQGPATAFGSATPWENTAWVELAAGFSESIGILSLTSDSWENHYPDYTSWEADIGVGAAGAEVVCSTIRGMFGGTYKIYGVRQFLLPQTLLVPANTRISLRLRVSAYPGESYTKTWSYWAMTYYGAYNPAPTGEEEFTPETDLTGETVPLIWTELNLVVGGFSGLYYWAKTDLPDPSTYFGGYKEPRILSVGPITRALSDRFGQYEAASFSVLVSDADRLIRGLLAGVESRYLLNRRMIARMISDAGRRAQLIPRTVGIGLIRDYQPTGPLQFVLDCEDYLALYTGLGTNPRQIPRRTLTLTDFPALPAGLAGRPVPVIYGEVSDRVETTPVETPGIALTTPTGITALVTGGTPGVTRRYACTAMNGAYGDPHSQAWDDHRGETDPAWITVNDAPTDEQIQGDPANHNVRIRIDAQAGQVCARIYGRYPDLIKGLDAMDHPGAWGVVPAGVFEYTDGLRPYGAADFDTLKYDGDPPAANNTVAGPAGGTLDTGTGVVPVTYVGERTLPDGNPWHEFLVAGHALKAVLGWYVGGVRQASSTEGPEWLIPGNAGWTALLGATPYRDYNGRRYSVIYGRGANAGQAASGSQALTLNVQGIEDVGDGSGTLISDLAAQYLHCLKNWLFGDYQAGAWLAGPEWPGFTPALPVIDEDSFTAVAAIMATRLAGGYPGAFIMGAAGEQLPIRDWLARFNLNGDMFSGFSRRCQYFVRTLDTGAGVLAASRRYTQVNDVVSPLRVVVKTQELENVVPYSYGRDWARNAWAVADGEAADATSITNTGERKVAKPLECYLLRNGPVAADVAQRRVLRMKIPPRVAAFDTNLGGLSTELGDVIRLSHLEGIGPTGWVDQPLFVLRHVLQPDTLRVNLEALDVGELFAGTFLLGDEAVLAASWPAATTAQREYGYLCDETTGLFSTGATGKRLR